MGNQQPNAATETPTAPQRGEEKVLLNVYEPREGQHPAGGALGFAAYHTGVEVFGVEYFFAGGEGQSGSGVHTQPPRASPPGSPWIYQKTVEIGVTTLSSREVADTANRLGSSSFNASTYHLLAKNCNHFSDAFCKAITKNKTGIPGWVNRAANWGNTFFGPGASATRPGAAEQPAEPPKQSVFESGQGYRLSDGSSSISSTAASSGSKRGGTAAPATGGQARKNPWRDPNFFPGKKDAASSGAGAGAGAGTA